MKEFWVLWTSGFDRLLVICNCDICVNSCAKVADVGNTWTYHKLSKSLFYGYFVEVIEEFSKP